MIEQSRNYLEDNVSAWGLPNGGEWNCMLFNNYQAQCTNLDLFWFHNDGKSPRVVAKLTRDEALLRREYDNLTRVHERAPAITPAPLAFRKSSPFSELWMKGVPGAPLDAVAPAADMVQSVGETITTLHERLRGEANAAARDRLKRMVLDPIATLAAFGNDQSVNDGCSDLLRRISEEWMSALPVIPQHGDLAAGNVLVSGRKIHIVDWESFGLVDLPLYDLLTFLLSLLLVSGNDPNAWDRKLAEAASRATSKYAVRLGLTAETRALLLPLSITNWFHLHTAEGRRDFSARMYRTISEYFKMPIAWNQVF